MARWWTALTGLFLSVFAIVALSGPGRIDIVDGQTRYEVARGLVEHGDTVIRDPRVWFAVFPGRDGQRYTTYRLPQSALGVAAILVADATGPRGEGRRHFFYTLTSAVAGAVLAVTFAAFFRHQGYGPRAALLWGAGGIFCTPCWFYGTSTFDDILGSAAVVLAICLSLAWRGPRGLAGAVAGGVLTGIAYHCKQPLGLFVLPVAALQYDSRRPFRDQWRRMALTVGLCLALAAVCQVYELYKFPPETAAARSRVMRLYGPFWTDDPLSSLLVLAFSLGAGFAFYSPSVLFCLAGWKAWGRTERDFCAALAGAILLYVAFLSFLTFFKGDPAWGPRYLTPVFALLWIFAPAGARLSRRWAAVAALTLGFVVQCGSLCTDPHRLYVEKGLPSAFYLADPYVYFHPSISHLIQRPREIVAAFQSRGDRAESFTPAPEPTFAFPVLDFIRRGPEAVQRFEVLRGFRFWWSSFQTLDRPARPVSIPRTVALLAILAVGGLIAQIMATQAPAPASELCSRLGKGKTRAGGTARRVSRRKDHIS